MHFAENGKPLKGGDIVECIVFSPEVQKALGINLKKVGAFIGYKTDHDPYERATSAGPKTSFFMSRCLQAEAQRMGVTILDGCPVIEFLTEGEGPARRPFLLIASPAPRRKRRGGA